MQIKKRNEIISPQDVEKTYLIHTGNYYRILKITANQVGMKFGEFVTTKIPAIYKKHGKKH